MAANDKWLQAQREGRGKTRVKMFQMRVSFTIPANNAKDSPIGQLNFRVCIRPYGEKQGVTDIEAPRGCIKAGRIVVPPGDEYLQKLRDQCDEVEKLAHRAFISLKTPTSCPTPRMVIEKMRVMKPVVAIANSFDDCVKEFRQSKAQEWSENTETFLDNMLAALKRYMTKELHVEQILLHEINEKFLTRFQLWMKLRGEKTGKGLSDSSVYQYMLKLTQVLEFAFMNDYITVNPCDRFSITQPKAENAPDMLDRKMRIDDQAKILNTGIPGDERLERGRLLMSLQMWTGLSYEDLSHYNLKNCIYTSLSGNKEFRYNRVKTGELALIPVFDEAVAILEKLGWNNNPGQYRTYLRLVESVFNHFGIPMEEQDGTHVLRHVFGSTMLEKGFSMEAVSRMLGHGSVSITESVYAKINSEKIHADHNYVRKREAM